MGKLAVPEAQLAEILPLLKARQAMRGKATEPKALNLIEWSEKHRYFRGSQMRVPGPLRELYASRARRLVVMKGAQLGISEWAINLMLYCADTGYANRGNALYVQPGGENVGDFVQSRVHPAIEQSDYISQRVSSGTNRDPDKVGLRKVGQGYTYWRTARSRAGLKSVPIDVLVLDEYDEMPLDTLSLASHRLDSSEDPTTVIISTPTYPGSGIQPEWESSDQRHYMLTCPGCGTEQPLEWDKNVDLETYSRVCVSCRESLEATIQSAWDGDIGRWVPTQDSVYPGYHISQLYRPQADMAEIHQALNSPSIERQQEAYNQHLGLPFSPPGNQLSQEELRRLIEAPFTLSQIAGIKGCWMGVDVGARMHCVITHDREGQRYLVGAYEVSGFDEIEDLMVRFGVTTCVVDAHPELHYAQEFKARHAGRVFLCDYQMGRMPPAFTEGEEKDPKQRYRIQVDRTGALDAVFGSLRSTNILFPQDAESVPGLFSHLMAPVRRLKPDKDGNPRAVYDEGAKEDHYAHSFVYAELASYIGNRVTQTGNFDPSTLSTLGAYERDLL